MVRGMKTLGEKVTRVPCHRSRIRRASASSSPSGVAGEMSMPGSVGPSLQKVKWTSPGWYGRAVPKPYPLPGPVARSLEVIGDRWTLLVVRELLLGGRRWAELERALPGIPSNLLAERLRLLEEEQVIERAAHERVYHLSDKGRDLAPVLASLAAWGTRHCGEPSSALATHAGCGGRVPPEELDILGLR